MRTALCCVVYDSYAQRHEHTCEQFLQFCMLVRFRFVFCVFIYVLSFCVFFHVSLAHFALVLFAFVFRTKPRDRLGKTYLK